MGTTEIIIVFAALMALIALVTIGIDWIGKPLKNRRFIPRMYRFDDEKLPVDAYGNTTLGVPEHAQSIPGAQVPLAAAPHPHTPPAPAAHGVSNQPAPVVVARIDELDIDPHRTVAVPTHTAGLQAEPTPPPSRSAFSDSLDDSAASDGTFASIGQDWLAATGPGTTLSASDWEPGLQLDATIDGEKPNLAVKAERFWKSIAVELDDSHFGPSDIERMQSGKAPRRTNPRTGRAEAMQLTGLRQASQPADVHMRWPGDAVDPWNAT